MRASLGVQASGPKVWEFRVRDFGRIRFDQLFGDVCGVSGSKSCAAKPLTSIRTCEFLSLISLKPKPYPKP